MTQKKLLIITHKPEKNYGGIAQAYALQKYLRNLGYEVDTTSTLGSPYFRFVISNPIVRKILKKKPLPQSSSIAENTKVFVNQNINLIDLREAKHRIQDKQYSGYISGSDQVWRREYSYVPDNLFSFVKLKTAPIIAYAASFGKDDIDEYGIFLKVRSRWLARRFVAISVREESGIEIVKRYWGMKAISVLDPTLLLGVETYNDLIDNPSIKLDTPRQGDIFTYILDPNTKTKALVARAEKELSKRTFKLITRDQNAGEVLPPFEEWLRCFRQAEFVITDSFHGTVFAIIFNKPFLAIGNESRGLTRFTSLLEKLSLSDRLFSDDKDLPISKLSEIPNWEHVNSLIAKEKEVSRQFLIDNLETI